MIRNRSNSQIRNNNNRDRIVPQQKEANTMNRNSDAM